MLDFCPLQIPGYICFLQVVRFAIVVVLQTLVNEVNGYCEKKAAVVTTGCRLTELSRKEDCDVIHNLMMTVQDRFKKLQQRASERGRTLEEVKKNAKQVNHVTDGRGGLHSRAQSLTICLCRSRSSSVNLGACWWTG